MADNADLSLLMERVNDMIAGQRRIQDDLTTLRSDVSWLMQNAATRSMMLAQTEVMSQFDSVLSTLDGRMATIEAKLAI